MNALTGDRKPLTHIGNPIFNAVGFKAKEFPTKSAV